MLRAKSSSSPRSSGSPPPGGFDEARLPLTTLPKFPEFPSTCAIIRKVQVELEITDIKFGYAGGKFARCLVLDAYQLRKMKTKA